MMTTVDPFWLHDRIDPEKDNDREEVIKAANAADELTGRHRPKRAINTLDEDDAFDSIRGFQKSRNLKVDGVVTPKGPTAQRIAAEKYRRAERRDGPVPAVVGLNAPLWGSVGRGGQNLRGDVKVARSAMMLAGQDFDAPEPGGHENENHAGGAAAADALARFQVQHGLQPDGLMTPFGETHQLLEALLAPRIQALAGSDRRRPKPFEPREPRVVGRTLKVRPTTIRSRFQDEGSLPTDAEHRAALDLMAARAGEIDLEMAWQEQVAANPELFALSDDVSGARPVSSIESEADTGALFGASGDDVLAGGEGGGDPVAATDDDRQSDPSGATEESEEMQSALARVAFLAPHLTPMQIEIAAQQVVDTGTLGLSDDRLRALVTRIGATNPDHANDLRNRIAAGNLDLPGLEGRLTSLTRDRVTAFGNRKRQQRTEATMEVLAEQYIDRSAAEGIEIDREAALQQVRRLMAAVTADEPIDIELLGDLLWTAVDFVPVAGEFKSAYEAVDLYGQIAEALERDPEADVSELRAEFNLAFLGAIPFLGKGIKLAKLGSKVKGALDKVSAAAGKASRKVKLAGTGGTRHHEQMLRHLDKLKARMEGRSDKGFLEHAAEFGRKSKLVGVLDRQFALRKTARMLRENAAGGPALSFAEMVKYSPELQKLSPSRIRSIQNTLNSALTGTVSQIYFRELLERASLVQLKNGKQTYSLRYKGPEGYKLRVYDAVLEKALVNRYRGLWSTTNDLPRGKALALDLKTGEYAKLTSDQKKTDDLVNSGYGDLVINQEVKRKDAEKGPILGAARVARMKITDIPRDQYMFKMHQILKKEGLSNDAIAAALRSVDIMYRLDSRLLEGVTLGAAAGATLIAAYAALDD